MAIYHYGDLEGDQETFGKANAITPTCEAGRVYLPEHAPCLNDLLDDSSMFPQVTTMTRWTA
jgi:phage terminase large subunit-like protein